MTLLIAALFAQVPLSAISVAQESMPSWRKLIPLKSTRSEVEKILGKPEQSYDSYALYRNENGRFSVWYSLGGCEHKIEGRQWDVPKGLMTSLSVDVNETLPLTRYVSNIGEFRQTEMPYNRILYVSPDESLIFKTIKAANRDEFVYTITFDPTKEQDKLLCKKTESSK